MKTLHAVLAALALLVAAPASPAPAPAAPNPMFARDDVIRLTIRGPITDIARNGRHGAAPRPATLSITGVPGEVHAITLAPRGITRLRPDICPFPPLRVDFAAPPPATSLFSGQKRLKLVTHCRPAESFQQYLLLEFAAYRLYNRLTPASFRVRLAAIDYVDDNGRPLTTRLGYFIEDLGDVAKRNGLGRPVTGDRILTSQLNARDAARAGLFEYLVANLDWSMRAGPPGDDCCHNSPLIGPDPGGTLVPVPYDFDYSGLVDVPYSAPPPMFGIPSVRVRYYRGFCVHNDLIPQAAAEFRSRRGDLMAELNAIPALDERTRRKASAFLDGFFNDISSDEKIRSKLLRTCLR